MKYDVFDIGKQILQNILIILNMNFCWSALAETLTKLLQDQVKEGVIWKSDYENMNWNWSTLELLQNFGIDRSLYVCNFPKHRPFLIQWVISYKGDEIGEFQIHMQLCSF